MKTYIALLRGINVSGQKPIKMDRLRLAFENGGYKNVKTYVQTGNVVFSSEEKETCELERVISKILEKDFSYKVTVFILTADKLKFIIENNPFVVDKQKDTRFIYVTFLAKVPKVDNEIITISEKKKTTEDFWLADNVVYLYCPEGYGITKLNNNFFEAKLKTSATTRNWKTLESLLDLCQ